jgi:hypothetical protein
MSKLPSVPLDHPVRRRILRQLHADVLQLPVDGLARELNLSRGEARYHAEVLAKWRTIRQVEGPTGPLVESLAAEEPDVIALLMSTRAEDEP